MAIGGVGGLGAQQQISPFAVSSLASFLQSPTSSQFALSPQFNPAGTNGQFFAELNQTMSPVYGQIQGALQDVQNYQIRKQVEQQQLAALAATGGLGALGGIGGLGGGLLGGAVPGAVAPAAGGLAAGGGLASALQSLMLMFNQLMQRMQGGQVPIA